MAVGNGNGNDNGNGLTAFNHGKHGKHGNSNDNDKAIRDLGLDDERSNGRCRSRSPIAKNQLPIAMSLV